MYPDPTSPAVEYSAMALFHSAHRDLSGQHMSERTKIELLQYQQGQYEAELIRLHQV